MHTEKRNLRVTYFAAPEAFRDYFKINYGPTISTYRFIADDPDGVAALDQDLWSSANALSGHRFHWAGLGVFDLHHSQGGLSLPRSMRAEPVEARYLMYEALGGGGRVGVTGRPRRASAILESHCGKPSTNRGERCGCHREAGDAKTNQH